MLREHDVRLIAIGKGIDTANGEDDFLLFREIIAEMYARDTSRKITAVMKNKGNSGQPLSYKCVYGYIKDPNDKNAWLIDEETAPIVRRIFRMAVDGMGPYQIAKILSDEKVERPAYYFHRTRSWADDRPNEPYAWTSTTVGRILEKPEYCGHTVNFRSHKESFKSKKIKQNPPEDWKVFENHHPALIDSGTFETVQRLRQTKRRPDSCGEANPLTGLVICHECGKRMHNHRMARSDYVAANFEGKEYIYKAPDYYACSTHNAGKNSLDKGCTQHYIRTAVIRELVLKAIQRVCGYVRANEAEFVEKVRESSVIKQADAAKTAKRKLSQNQRRIAELDRLFESVYEDKVSGVLSEERFTQLSAKYEAEQAELKAQNIELQTQVDAFAEDSVKADRFIEIVRKHTEFSELTTPMLNEFVSRIEVYESDKSSGKRTQRVDVCFNFIDKFEPPQESSAPPTPEELAEEEKRLAKQASARVQSPLVYEPQSGGTRRKASATVVITTD
jgi:hypothetical protein